MTETSKMGIDPRHYLRVVSWSDEDGAWICDVPELPHTAADGTSPEEAMRNVEPYIADWLETAQAEGWEIPQPKGRDALQVA